MSKTILHKAESRGDANHGWLHSKQTFSLQNTEILSGCTLVYCVS